MYHNVFRYEYLTFQTQIHLHKQDIFDTNIIQSEYAFLFPFSIFKIHGGLYMMPRKVCKTKFKEKNISGV